METTGFSVSAPHLISHKDGSCMGDEFFGGLDYGSTTYAGGIPEVIITSSGFVFEGKDIWCLMSRKDIEADAT